MIGQRAGLNSGSLDGSNVGAITSTGGAADYRVMNVHGLLLHRHSGKADERRHDGRVAVDTRNTRCSDAADLMTATVEHRFGRVNRLPTTIEWLTDNGSCYTAKETRRFAREINLRPRTTPIKSPQSNGMAEAFVRAMKRDFVRFAEKPDARAVNQPPAKRVPPLQIAHLHRALGYLATREYINRSMSEELSGS